MKSRGKKALIALGSALVTVAIIGVAAAGSENNVPSRGSGIPEGPYVDFCPTVEQTEAHLAEYGFDYKPTVTCGREGEAQASDPTSTPTDDIPEGQREAEEKAFLESARRARDEDGDPATMEIILPDGRTMVIYINTDNPERYKDMTPSEFAEEVYP